MYVPSLLPTESAKEVSLNKAMCISLKCFSQVLAQHHPFKSLLNYTSVQFPNVWPLSCFDSRR